MASPSVANTENTPGRSSGTSMEAPSVQYRIALRLASSIVLASAIGRHE